MDALGVEVGEEAQVVHPALALEEARARIGPIGDVGLGEPRFEGAGHDGVDVGDRTVRRLRGEDELRRVGDRVRDEAADRVIGAGRAARADAEEGGRLREGGAASRAAAPSPRPRRPTSRRVRVVDMKISR